MSSRFALAAILVFVLSSTIQAQQYPIPNRGSANRQQQQQNNQSAQIQGTLQSVARGGIVVLDDKGQTWRIAIGTATKVHVLGTTTPDKLRSNLIVEFTGTFNNGVLQDKLDSLTVTSLTNDKPMGVYPADEGGSDANNSGNTAKRRVSGKAATSGRFHIVGKLIVRGNTLSVQTGRSTLTLALSDKATVKIDSADLSIARQGNDVTVRAAVSQNRPGVAQAYEVTVKLPDAAAKPDDKDEPAAKPKDKRPSAD